MSRLWMLAGALAALVLANPNTAKADGWVDTPSFGRIVYGITGGDVILPADAWIGYYPDNTANTALPADATFTGGANPHYIGDNGSLAPASYSDVGVTLTVNATQVGNLYSPLTLTNGNAGVWPKDKVSSIKLAYVSSMGKLSEVDLKSASGTPVLFAAGSAAGSTKTLVVDDPFAFVFHSVGAAAQPFHAESDNLAANGGSAANQLYNHFKVYEYATAKQTVYFVGMEDWNYDTTGTGHRRWDWNDTVIALTFKAVPEPAFYQMAGLLSLGGLGLLRLRRRSA